MSEQSGGALHQEQGVRTGFGRGLFGEGLRGLVLHATPTELAPGILSPEEQARVAELGAYAALNRLRHEAQIEAAELDDDLPADL